MSPIAAARARYAVAATIVLFLERLRLGAELPRIMHTEILGQDRLSRR